MKWSDEAYGQDFVGVIIELLDMVRRFVNSSVASGKFQAITRLVPVVDFPGSKLRSGAQL